MWKRQVTVAVVVAFSLLGAAGCPPKPAPGPVPPPTPSGPPSPTVVIPPPPEPAFRKRLAERAQVFQAQEGFRKELIRGFGFHDDETSCIAPPPLDAAAIDVNKSLLVHDTPTLDGPTKPFALRKTLGQLAAQAVAAGAPGVTAESLFRDLWDTQNPDPGEGGPLHCDDSPSPVPGPGVGGLNGFPVHCRPTDGAQARAATLAAALDAYRPLALVNRIDLAHEGWRNCGEHRIVYGINGGGGAHRNFIIFEAVLPNPKPGCRSACKPVMDFWAGLSTVDTPTRQDRLEKFFYKSPGLLPGFQPVVHIDHYTAKGVGSTYGSSGSGQIRTNQFFEFPWLLKEFHVLLDCGTPPCSFSTVPNMVKVNPFGQLWNQAVADASPPGPFATRAAAFQADLLAGAPPASVPPQMQQLASASFDGIGYSVDLEFDAAESDSLTGGSSPDHYRNQLNGSSAAAGFKAAFGSAATAAGSDATKLVNRALGLSCAGCHQPSTFGINAPGAIGNASLVGGAVIDAWPNSAPGGFVHVTEQLVGSSFTLSPALTDVFLPSRKANLVDRLQDETCLCKQTFARLSAAERATAETLQTDLLKKLKPDLDKIKQRIKIGQPGVRPPPADTVKSRAEVLKGVSETERKGDSELARALQEKGIKPAPVVPDMTVQPDKLDAATRAGGNAKKARQLRAQAVTEQLKSEPPRRTVTGSFRVH